MRRTFLIVCAWWLATIACTPVHEAIAEDRFRVEADSVRQTLERLAGIGVKARDPDIPSAVKPLLTTLKHQLRDLIIRIVNDETIRWNTPDDLTSQVLSSLREHGITVGASDKDQDDWEEEERREYAYNDIRRISIEVPANHPDLLVATTTLWVMCGEDTSFYLFRRTKGAWHLVLAQEASNYRDVTGAQARFGYAVSPSDKHGDFFVVTANVNPWCSSNWQSLRYAVARPGRTPYHPETLMKRSDTIYLGIDPPVYTLTVERTRFRLAFHGDWYWNPDLGASHQFAEYRVMRHRLSLIQRGKVKSRSQLP
jgi:hypothetical protein